jgi:hypothetical protein
MANRGTGVMRSGVEVGEESKMSEMADQAP